MSGIGTGLAALNIGAKLTGVSGMLKKVPLWVWAVLAVAATLGWALHSRNHWKALAADRGSQLVVICQATRDAAARPRLACGQVPLQIKFLGQAVTGLKGAIGRQNAAVAVLGVKTAQQQAEAAQATKQALKRADQALATSQRLTASARRAPPPGAPCEPSPTLKDAWK